MSYKVKFGICVAAGLIGFGLVMARQSIESLAVGFLIVAIAVACGHYFWARMRQPRNSMEDEIAVLAKKGEENLRDQDRGK